MPDYIASYDITNTAPSPYGVFIDQARAQGWKVWITTDDGKTFRLPNTTLVGTFSDIDAAERALTGALYATQRALGVAVLMPKWIIAERNRTVISSNETL